MVLRGATAILSRFRPVLVVSGPGDRSSAARRSRALYRIRDRALPGGRLHEFLAMDAQRSLRLRFACLRRMARVSPVAARTPSGSRRSPGDRAQVRACGRFLRRARARCPSRDRAIGEHGHARTRTGPGFPGILPQRCPWRHRSKSENKTDPLGMRLPTLIRGTEAKCPCCVSKVTVWHPTYKLNCLKSDSSSVA